MALQVSKLTETCDYNLLAALLMIVECFDHNFYRLDVRRFEILPVFRPSLFLFFDIAFRRVLRVQPPSDRAQCFSFASVLLSCMDSISQMHMGNKHTDL